MSLELSQIAHSLDLYLVTSYLPRFFSIYSSPWNFFSSRLDRRIRLDLITVLFAGVSVHILYPVYSLYSLDRLRLSRNLPTRTLAQITLTESSLYIPRHPQLLSTSPTSSFVWLFSVS